MFGNGIIIKKIYYHQHHQKQRTPQIKTFISRGPPPKRKPPPRKSSVAKKLSDQLSFQLHDMFTPDPNAQQGWSNKNTLPPRTPPNDPLTEKNWFLGDLEEKEESVNLEKENQIKRKEEEPVENIKRKLEKKKKKKKKN